AMTFAEAELRQYVLSEDEWEKIKLLVEVLMPFKDENKRRDNMPEWLVQGCEAAINKLLGYCHKTNILHLSAVVLDPRFKIKYFEELKWSSQLITQIRD
ncbi:10031_t:CDS:2, partial [Cetraspora pellucida]